MLSRFQLFAKNTVNSGKQAVKQLSFEEGNKIAGVLIGAGTGIYFNQWRIRTTNHYIRTYNGEPNDMPKYPTELRLVTGAMAATFGSSVGFMIGGISLVVPASIWRFAYYLFEKSDAYDEQCKHVYDELTKTNQNK